MNIHPLFVHFPIALLTIYAFLEIISFKKITSNKESWFYIKFAFLFFGMVGASTALITGPLAAKLLKSKYNIIEFHELFAQLTTIIFLIPSTAYLAELINKFFGQKIMQTKIAEVWDVAIKLKDKLFCRPIAILFAIAGFSSLLITGALGASIVYGPESDIFVSIIYHLFFK